MSAPLVLASASPRRRELLAQLRLPFEVVPSDVPEVRLPDESSECFAARVARAKATAIARQRPDAVVLAADTIVVVDDVIFGKPQNRDDARRMLQALSGRRHRVLTAVTMLDPTGRVDELLVESTVDFHVLTPDAIETYLDTGEAFDKAGSYAVQGIARDFVSAVHGSRSNVIGLPIEEVAALLRRHRVLTEEADAPR